MQHMNKRKNKLALNTERSFVASQNMLLQNSAVFWDNLKLAEGARRT
jgi:hypothetical protein